jgi:predicted RNA-binding Zn ribbon-like protein
VDFGAYAESAVRLVNADLDDLDALRSLVAERSWYVERLGPRDLATLRALQRRLREVWALAADDSPVEAVAALNALLALSPVSPRVAGHDGAPWHLHVTARGSAPGDDLAAEALVGLAVAVVEHGPERLGRCGASGCLGVFLDTSPGGTRRYCSARCASRTGVAAFRARRRGHS